RQRQAGLRLDQREKAIFKLESGERAIVPGKPDDSEVLHRAAADDADERMPPKSMNKRLTPAQTDVLRRWIAGGANYAPPWALSKPVRPRLPEVRDKKWARNEIDRFIL